MQNRTAFVTGATGLVGSYLIKRLLGKNNKVYALSRSQQNKQAAARVFDALGFWEMPFETINCANLRIVEGDITLPDLGLSPDTTDLLQEEVDCVFHCAENTLFNQSIESIRRINVEGTRNILDSAMVWYDKGRLAKVHHLSTIFICGDYSGTFAETDLDKGQSFSNTYSQTKFEAEKLVDEFRERGLWIDVYQLPFVLGESKTGRTPVFQVVYWLLRFVVYNMLNEYPIVGAAFPGTPIDILANGLLAIAGTRRKNRNYHMFSSDIWSTDVLLKTFCDLAGLKTPNMVRMEDLNGKTFTPMQKKTLSLFSMIPNRIQFKADATNRLASKFGFSFQGLDPELLLVLFNYAMESGFIKNQPSSAS